MSNASADPSPGPASPSLGDALLHEMHERFRAQRTFVERALAQVDDAAFVATLDDDANSIAVILQHMAGNLRSRFTDFLTTDGEKPDRGRDGEFEVGPGRSRADVEARWHEGWGVLERALNALGPDDLLRTVHIRGEAMPVVQALGRALAHMAQHAGQVVLLAKHFAGPSWRTLSIPRAGRAEVRADPHARPQA